MAAYFNEFDFEPVKTYATRDNAIKAVQKWADKFDFKGRAFNVMVVTVRDFSHVNVTRFCPVMINIDKDFLQNAIHSGFNVIN